MTRPRTWDTLPSIEVWPKLTFFGLDKNQAHCFTLPKSCTDIMIEHFNLSSDNLQRRIVFVIGGVDFDAQIRMVVMNRSKTRIRKPEELPKRIVVQFQWVSFPNTQDQFRTRLANEYNLIKDGKNGSGDSVIFHHARMNRFYVEFNKKESRHFEIRS